MQCKEALKEAMFRRYSLWLPARAAAIISQAECFDHDDRRYSYHDCRLHSTSVDPHVHPQPAVLDQLCRGWDCCRPSYFILSQTGAARSPGLSVSQYLHFMYLKGSSPPGWKSQLFSCSRSKALPAAGDSSSCSSSSPLTNSD